MAEQLTTGGNPRIADWNDYSGPFTSVTPYKMLQLNEEVASHMDGDAVDFVCGGGKIIPFVMTRASVASYTGIDSSPAMIMKARWMADQFGPSKAVLVNDCIEAISLTHTESALSINSYYSWPDPVVVLRHIHTQLSPGTRFVLATINPSIDMPALLAEAEKQMIAHPHWAEFKRHNLAISASSAVNFVEMDTLIDQLCDVGFGILSAHCELYDGGLNLVVCRKSRS